MVHAESGTVSSPSSGGMASPYSDHSTGVPSPPTVVSEYNRPVDAHSTDGPHLVLTEQPQSKFRFRYKSEMVGTHGQLKAENADRNKPLFPTVKLMKWRDGPALIRLALYTGEDNFNQRTRHVHELGGKNCDKDTGMCEMVVDHTTDYTASFQNLGIIHIAKRDVKDIIKQRKKKRLIDEMSMRQPHRSIEEIRLSITPTDMKKIEEEADEISKTMDLNKVVLRFQAFHYDTSVDCYRALTRPVDSELVVNLKNASTGELKIVRMSECSAPCSGGTEVWMLVEKVKKSNIKIKFYELDSEFKEVWSAYGEFSESDVHHQYAIIFRTPPYRTSNLRQSVRVKVQLERPNDKDMSEPRDFTYYPSNRKRQSPFMETTKVEEEEDYSYGERSHKRHRQGSTEPLDLRSWPGTNGDNCPIDGMMDVFSNYYNTANFSEDSNSSDFRPNGGMSSVQLSPNYTVPSPNHPSASPNSNQSFYQTNNTSASDNNSHNMMQVPQIQVMVGNSAPYLLPGPNVSPVTSSNQQAPSPQSQINNSYQSANSPLQNMSSPASTYIQSPSPSYQQSPSPSYQQSPSPSYLQSPSPSYQQSPSPSYQQSPSHPYQQSSSPTYQQSPSPSYQSYSNDNQMVPKSPPNADNLINSQGLMVQQLQQTSNNLSINQTHINGQIMNNNQGRNNLSNLQMNNVQMASLNTPTINTDSSTDEWNFQNLLQNSNEGALSGIDLMDSISLDHINPDLFSLSDLQTDCFKEKPSSEKRRSHSLDSTKPCQKNTLEDLSRLMDKVNLSERKPMMKQKKMVAGSMDIAFLVAVSAAESLQAYAATGDMGRLLATHRYLLAVQNNQGDNALHTAVSNSNWDAFNKILNASQKMSKELINTQNYAGETPLHLAVRSGEMAMTEKLVGIAGTDISVTDRNGDTALHIAASLSVKKPDTAFADIMARLINKPAVNGTRKTLENVLQIYNYQGETALHVAVMSNNLVAVRQMVAAGASVHLCERKRGANCLHLAAQNRCLDIAHFLINHTTMTVNSRMFDGNTALHIAAQEGDMTLCAILMEAGADPHAKNSLKIRNNSEVNEHDSDNDNDSDNEDDSEDEESDEPDCYTPVDYAEGNQEILQILEGQTGSSKIPEKRENVMDSGIDVSATDLSAASVV